MTIIALLFGLSAIALYICAKYHANRAANLEILLTQQRLVIDGYKAQNEEIACLLDDATRLSERLHVSNAHHIREGLIMTAKIEALTCANRALESLLCHRKDTAAGVILTQHLVNPRRKMTLHEAGKVSAP